MAEERSDVITFNGGQLTLIGPELREGDTAPAVTLVNEDLEHVALPEMGMAQLVITLPSVDTSVCSLETKRFSEAVRSLDTTQIKVTAVSADLPFALKRWCDAAGVDNLVMLSDYRGAELAQSWGLLIKELRLIARAVYVLDRSGRVTYRQIVSEITHEPNYAAAIDAVQRAAG